MPDGDAARNLVEFVEVAMPAIRNNWQKYYW